MKIKHYQGYGIVEAKKLKTRKLTKAERGVEYADLPLREVQIFVKGNHECGLLTLEKYAVHRWLCTKLVKDCESFMDIIDVNAEPGMTKENGLDVETALYTIIYISRGV